MEIRKELGKMNQVEGALKKLGGSTCSDSIINSIDSYPCFLREWDDSVVQVPGSYVMPLMDGDLDDYRTRWPGCDEVIASQAATALNCFHRAGWVHADVKPANFLYKGLQNHKGLPNPCPKSIQLADFGLSGEQGTTANQHTNYYDARNGAWLSWYLPGTVFSISKEHLRQMPGLWSLQLNRPAKDGKPQYEYQPQIDWCSFHYYFPAGAHASRWWHGNCGPMGPGRATDVVVP